MSKSVAVSDVSLPDTSVLEEALLAVAAVRGARIILDDDAGIGEIHVIATARRSPKKIVRDIESLLLVRYGYRVDYRRISLVQIAEQALAERISLSRVELVQQPEGTFLEVELFNGEQRVKGTSVLEDDPAIAAGKATVLALNTFFAPSVPLELGGVQCTTIGSREVVTAYVTYQATTLEHVLGTTFVRNSLPEAAARAVLASTNRRIAAWLSEAQAAPVAEAVVA